MLRSSKSIFGYALHAEDGEIGEVHDLYFQEREWVFHYLIADTGPWILGRRVLISLYALSQPDWASQSIGVALTKEQVQNSPEIDFEQPLSREEEIDLHRYYGWPVYWRVPPGLLPGPYAQGEPVEGQIKSQVEQITAEERRADPQIRSAREVFGYDIAARDGGVGYLDDFIFDTEDWVIRYLVVNTRAWLPGRDVLVAPQWVERIHHAGSVIEVDLERETIKNSPEYDPEEPVNRDYENRLYDYYGRRKYWERP